MAKAICFNGFTLLINTLSVCFVEVVRSLTGEIGGAHALQRGLDDAPFRHTVKGEFAALTILLERLTRARTPVAGLGLLAVQSRCTLQQARAELARFTHVLTGRGIHRARRHADKTW